MPEPEVPAAGRGAYCGSSRDGAPSCTDTRAAYRPEPGQSGERHVLVHVDAEGRVLEVREFKTDAPFRLKYRTDALVEAIRKVTYRPFLRNGVATEAWVQDEVEVGTESARPLPPEAEGLFPRWRNRQTSPSGFLAQVVMAPAQATPW